MSNFPILQILNLKKLNITVEEIKHAFYQMKSDPALGEEGKSKDILCIKKTTNETWVTIVA